MIELNIPYFASERAVTPQFSVVGMEQQIQHLSNRNAYATGWHFFPGHQGTKTDWKTVKDLIHRILRTQ